MSNVSNSVSLYSFLRQPSILDNFGPSKPAPSRYEYKNYAANEDYRQKVEVFLYNTTANIANAAVITSATAVAATMFSMIGWVFAGLVIGGSLVTHRIAIQSLPMIENRAREGEDASMYVQNRGQRSLDSVTHRFGLEHDSFRSKEGIWKQFALSVSGYDIWANTLPANPAVAVAAESVSSSASSAKRAEGEDTSKN